MMAIGKLGFTNSKWYCTRQGVGELARRIKFTLNRLWNSQSIFWFSQWSIPFLEWRLGWYGFLPLAGLIYWAAFFWKELNIDSLCFFFPVYFFGNDIFSKWWNKHFRGARNHFFHCPNMVDRPLNNFLENFQKILSVDFTLWWWYLCWYNFLEKEVKNI